MGDKVNCWEFLKCGRQPGGGHVADEGVCPAAIDRSHEGVNGGQAAGRYCWRVAGTLCSGVVQGSYAMKLKDCLECPFFGKVQEEEDRCFKL